MGRILIIDDEESLRYTFSSFLSRNGHEVLSEPSFDRAEKLIEEHAFDVILSDIFFPDGHTGMDLLRLLRERQQTTPVIMITGQPDIDTAAESVRLGAFDYVPKPVTKEALIRLVNAALRHKNLEDRRRAVEKENTLYRKNLEAIFRSVEDAIITVDGDMRVIAANDAAATICGIDPAEAPGHVFSPSRTDCSTACVEILQKTLGSRTGMRDVRLECGCRERPSQIVAVNSSILNGPEDEFLGAVMVLRDLTVLAGLERELEERREFHGIIGKSEPMRKLYELIRELACMDTTVLVTGESGTGKELVADALHTAGNRASKPLIKVNCSALPEHLLESELFGHVKGAFTGAHKDRPGRFLLARGGTLFLDEIGDISPSVQVKLLRVIQEKELERVGSTVTEKVDVRIVTATNHDLKEKVQNGTFRKDLYYRLRVVEIAIPPLRERTEDIPALVAHFCQIVRRSSGKPVDGISKEAMDRLMAYPWPGNVRELKHAVEHAFVLCREKTIGVEHLPPELPDSGPPRPDECLPMAGDERKTIQHTLTRTAGNKARAARILGISRPTLYRKIREYGISEE